MSRDVLHGLAPHTLHVRGLDERGLSYFGRYACGLVLTSVDWWAGWCAWAAAAALEDASTYKLPSVDASCTARTHCIPRGDACPCCAALFPTNLRRCPLHLPSTPPPTHPLTHSTHSMLPPSLCRLEVHVELTGGWEDRGAACCQPRFWDANSRQLLRTTARHTEVCPCRGRRPHLPSMLQTPKTCAPLGATHACRAWPGTTWRRRRGRCWTPCSPWNASRQAGRP